MSVYFEHMQNSICYTGNGTPRGGIKQDTQNRKKNLKTINNKTEKKTEKGFISILIQRTMFQPATMQSCMLNRAKWDIIPCRHAVKRIVQYPKGLLREVTANSASEISQSFTFLNSLLHSWIYPSALLSLKLWETNKAERLIIFCLGTERGG